ncbi:MAG: hypothetical protein KAS12_00470, partial [Candidatus Aenigmarchaeota archaeon]|nr:hypothetical protein [Candidatus Aenigmarchaeota archaeon]
MVANFSYNQEVDSTTAKYLSSDRLFDVLNSSNNSNNVYFSKSNIVDEKSIDIINKYSYPKVGSDWNIFFETTGSDDLVISNLNPRSILFKEIYYYKNDSNTWRQIETESIGDNYSVYWKYDKGKAVFNEIFAGKHSVLFTFGDVVDYAYNDAFTNQKTFSYNKSEQSFEYENKEFNDTQTTKELTFDTPKNNTVWIELPQNATINSANLTLIGGIYDEDYFTVTRGLKIIALGDVIGLDGVEELFGSTGNPTDYAPHGDLYLSDTTFNRSMYIGINREIFDIAIGNITNDA